jgi:hypothetical protein
VFDLLPPEWSELLGQLRTGTICYDGLSIKLEKFSSMGNGFTFELESLIFWALALGCCRTVGVDVEHVGVYGDDIIVPTDAAGLLYEVLDHCGFWVNTQKSYIDGPFRESCGADWLNGKDVRPFYLRELISDRVLYIFHNWAIRHGERKLAAICEAWTWEPIRIYGPDGYGDGHLLGGHDLYSRRRDRRRGWCGGYFDTYRLRSLRQPKRRSGDWVVPTYSTYVRGLTPDLSNSGKSGPSWEKEQLPIDPYKTRGSHGYDRTPIYTLSSSIFCG